MRAIRTVLFDLDGTLLDSLAAHYRVYQKVFGGLGMALDPAVYARTYSPNWYIFYERMGVPKDRWHEADRLWLRFYEAEAPHPRAGAEDVLRAVRRSGRALGVVTSGDRSRVERDLHRAGWERLFDIVVCGGDVADRKPLPGALLHALAHLAADPAAAIYVGDTVEDVAMGQAAGTLTAAVLGGFSSREQLAATRPDYLVDSLTDLIEIVAD